MPLPDPRRLEELLDAAGRDAQPTALGWQSLPARLAQTPQQKSHGTSRWRTLPIGAAVAATILLILWWTLAPRQHVEADEQPIEVRREAVDLTILSASETDGETLYMPILLRLAQKHLLSGQVVSGKKGRLRETGQALVKDRRLVLNLKAGDNIVRFTDIAATIDPTSVRFESTTDPQGTTVVEQSFEYDLATADALLKRYVDREIVCVDDKGQELNGYLASFDDSILVLTTAPSSQAGQPPGAQTIHRASLQALRLKEMPADLIVKPTLVWKLRTRTPGKHHTVLTYICGFVKWHVDYVVQLNPAAGQEPDLLDIHGWATLMNTSGTTYPRAGLRLIAGDVHRLPDPWARQLLQSATEGRDLQEQIVDFGDGEKLGAHYLMTDYKFVEQSLFEYHLYALSAPCTVRDHQVKQLVFLQREGVKAKRRYVFDPIMDEHAVAVELLVKNDKENNLGLPLPKGRVALQQRDADGDTVVLARDVIEHTAVKEELTLKAGRAFDIVGEQREVLVEKLNEKNKRVTYEIKVRNHKPMAIAVRAYAVRLGKTGTLRQASLPYQQEDFQTIYFDFTLPANAEQTIRYTVVYRSLP
jgi:hypothetical protein